MSMINIGNGVVTTEEVEAQGFDYIGLKMAGQLKTPGQVAGQDPTLTDGPKYRPPGYVSDFEFTTNLPLSQTGEAPVELSIVVDKGVEPYTYQWFDGSTPIAGATSATFNAQVSGLYKVVAKDAELNEITSNVAEVTIVAALAFTTNLPGNNTSDAVATYLALGSNKTFTVAVTGGVAPYSYAWFRRAGGVDNPVGANQNTYSIAGYAASNNGDYFCRVTDANGTVIESARERTKPAIRLTTNLPASLTLEEGETATLSVVATDGLPPYTYEWREDGYIITGATSSTLQIPTGTARRTPPYWCIVTGSNTSNPRSIQSDTCQVTLNYE